MSPISCKTGQTWVVKKGKSSEFNLQNDEHVKSSSAPKVWSHKGSNLHPKNCQNFSLGQNFPMDMNIVFEVLLPMALQKYSTCMVHSENIARGTTGPGNSFYNLS